MEEIAVFTSGEDKPLKEILKVIYEKQEGKATLDAKSGDKEIKDFFLEMVPDYDKDRVYISDIRKIISWYNILLENELLDFTEKAEEELAKEDTPSEEATAEKKSGTEIKETEPKTAKKKGAGKTPSKGTPRKRKTEE